MRYDGFDGVGGGFDGVDGGFDGVDGGFDGFDGLPSMASTEVRVARWPWELQGFGSRWVDVCQNEEGVDVFSDMVCCDDVGSDGFDGVDGGFVASMVASMAPGARMEIVSAAMKDLKAVAPVLIWSKLENKLLVLQQPSYENSSKIWLGSMFLMAAGDDGPDDAMVKMELMTCQLGALDDSDKWWRRWLASMVGVDGWRRWLASMVDWGLRHRGQ